MKNKKMIIKDLFKGKTLEVWRDEDHIYFNFGEKGVTLMYTKKGYVLLFKDFDKYIKKYKMEVLKHGDTR